MASWYVEQRNARLRTGQTRRRNAWLALGFAVSAYMTVWAWRSFLG